MIVKNPIKNSFLLMLVLFSSNSFIFGNMIIPISSQLNPSAFSSLQQSDTVAPILNVIQPIKSDSFNETSILVALEGRDETAWKDLTISIGEITLLQINNTEIFVNQPELKYNQTYIFLQTQFNLHNLPPLSSKAFTIILSDAGGNTDTFSLNINADISKPLVKWISPSNDEMLYEDNFILSWEIADESPIKSQKIDINGNLVFNNLTSDQRSVNITLPSTLSINTIFVFSLTVIDIYDNQIRIQISIIYVQEINNQATQQTFLERTNLDLLILIFFMIMGIIGLGNYLIKQSSEDPIFDKKSKKKWKGELLPPPLTELIEYLSMKDHTKILQYIDLFLQVENTWNDLTEKISTNKYSIGEITNELDIFISNTLLQMMNDVTLSTQNLVEIEKDLQVWKNDVLSKPVKWQGKLKPPPLLEIVEEFPSDKFKDYERFFKVIEDLLDSWQSVDSTINELEHPTQAVVKAILNDYESEIKIMLVKDNEFNKNDMNLINQKINQWMNNIIHDK